MVLPSAPPPRGHSRGSAGQCFSSDGRQYLARVVAGQPAAGEEDVGRGDLVRMRRPAHRYLAAERADLLPRESGGDQRRPDRPGRHAVHPDAAVLQGLGGGGGGGGGGGLGGGGGG